MSGLRQTGVIVVLLPLALFAASCRADIWGFVDDKGVAHLSDRQVDERYYLFKKEPPRPENQFTLDPERMQTGIGHINPANRAQFSPLIAQVAREHDLDVALMHAIITVESGYNPQARSPAGAMGLMQLMPGTAIRYGVRNILDPLENLQGGARYLRFLLALFPGNIELVLAAYNAGEGAVQQAGNRIPPYAETRAYVPSVLTYYQRYRATAPNNRVTPPSGGVIPAEAVRTTREPPVEIR